MLSGKAMTFINSKKQSGAALFVSLIFLLVLTVLGISSMNDTILQGKMAGAIQDGNVALQGAESASRVAERAIENLITTAPFGTTGPLYTAGNAPDPYNRAIWADDTLTRAAPALAGQTDAPRYFIELAGEVEVEIENDDVGTVGNQGAVQQPTIVTTFRIVSRGTGGTSNSQRIIESYYGRRLP